MDEKIASFMWWTWSSPGREKTSNREVILLSICVYWWGLGTHNNDGNVSKLVPARLNNDIRSSLTTSSTLPAFSATATSSSDTSCSATTYRCCWHLYIRTGRAVVLLLVDGWPGCWTFEYWLILILVGYRLIHTRRTTPYWRKRRITRTLKIWTIALV